jgi:hypothetical protein
LVGGVDRDCSTSLLSMLLARNGLKRCWIVASRIAGWATTSCGGQLSLTVTADT